MKILALQHVDHESLGHIGSYARERGIELDVVELWKPYVIPDPKHYSLIIVLGGPMGVYEDFPSKNDEINLIKEYIGHIPFIGICLGSQLIAHALGAEVRPNTGGKEIGYYDIELTESGQKSPVFKDFPSSVRALEWHGDAFELPQGTTLLARTVACPNQAFSYAKAFGILFHFEFTAEMVRNLVQIDRAWTHKNFDLNESALMQEAEKIEPLMKMQCYRLLDNILV